MNKRACLESSDTQDIGEVMEVQEVQLQQASQAHEMDADIQDLVLKHQEMDSAFYKSLNDKAGALIADAKRESVIILQDAEKEAESNLAGAVAEAAEKTALVQDAEKKAEAILSGAEAILAGAAEEKQKWEAEKKAEKETMSKVQHFEPIVKLNVGGVRVMTSLATLRRFPDTMMGCMFSGRHTLPKGEDGHFFIDRDGTHFRHILNFLRSPESYKMEVEGTDVKELRLEADYYCLEELMFPATTTGNVKYLVYYEHRGLSIYPRNIHVLVDRAGVHTIQGSGRDKIECCPRCKSGFFRLGAGGFIGYFKDFHLQSPSAQPRLKGKCPHCQPV
jgi:hypothetical protein